MSKENSKDIISSYIKFKQKFSSLDEAVGITNETIMTDPRYLKQSATLINNSLKKGFDILQLENGDIVTTGTKTVVYRYSWDEEKGRLVKASSKSSEQEVVEESVNDAIDA